MSAGPLTYEPFFGLHKKPFSLASDPDFLYESPAHSAALATLLAGIRRREGLLAFTGDIGTGKTTICRAVLRNLDRTTFSAFIPDPFAAREDLLKMLLIEFGVATVADIATGPLARAGRTELSYLLASFLDTLLPLEAFVVVFIDEAQNMSLSLLEEVRVLSDAFNRHGQLQVVLVGQLELLEKLKSPTMRQVDQRVSVYTRLEPLTRADLIGYVQHRLLVSGATPNRPLFTPTALSLIHDASAGIPRIINRICDRALQIAYEHRSPLIERNTIADALGQTQDEPTAGRPDAPAPGAVTPPGSDAFTTHVETWLARVDERPSPALVADEAMLPLAAVSAPAPTLPLPLATPPPPAAPVPFEAPLRRRQPERYIQRLARRWTRAGVMVILALAALNAVVAAATYVPRRFTSRLQPADLPPRPAPRGFALRPIAAPGGPEIAARVPVGGARPASAVVTPAAVAAGSQYAVAVGAYTTTTRADLMIGTLRDMGFAAFRIEGRLLHQVLAGPFADRAAAQLALLRLQTAGDYADATVLPLRR